MTKNFLYVAFLDFIVRRIGSRAAATSKMERFVIIVNGCLSDPGIVRLLWQKDWEGTAELNDAFKVLPWLLNYRQLYS